jgi:pimeloyl-ACP methyl ester carboxylesterase
VNEYPLYLPHRDVHLATVLTLPDTDPRGVVLLLPGGGAGRSHKNRMWTRLAERLAERDIAAVRMDYPGIGDSTGAADSFGLGTTPVDEAVAVMETARKLAGVDHTGVLGHCYGARTAIGLASHMDSCVTAAITVFGGRKVLTDAKGPSQRRPPEALARRLARKVRSVARRSGTAPDHKRSGFRNLEAAARSTDILFMMSVGRSPAFRQFLSRLPAWSGHGRGRIEVVELPTRWDYDQEDAMGIVTQQPLIDAVTRWMDESLPGKAHLARDGASTA